MTCQQEGCTKSATKEVFWPGKVTQQCDEHAAGVARLGAFMGVGTVETRNLPAEEPARPITLIANEYLRKIDLKHHIDTLGRIIKTGNGVEVPHDEPLMLFRARDRLAVPMLLRYRELCVADGCNDFQLAQVDELIAKFINFAAANPATMKQPGVTRGL